MNQTTQKTMAFTAALALLLLTGGCAGIDPIDLIDTSDTAQQDTNLIDTNDVLTQHDVPPANDIENLEDTSPIQDTNPDHDTETPPDVTPPSPCQSASIDTEGICDIWILRGHKNQWEGYSRTFNNPAAAVPQGTIRAAFDSEHQNLAFVLTDTTIYTLNPTLLTWTSTRPISDFSPAIGPSMPPRAAYTVAPRDPAATEEHVSLMSVQGNTLRSWDRMYNIATNKFVLPTFAHASDGDVFTWDDPNAPPTSMITASWMDLDNQRGIMPGSPKEFCNKGKDKFGPYIAVMTSQHVHFADVGWFCGFTKPVPLSELAILQLPGAPPTSNIGAAFWHQGNLFIFAAD